MLVYMHAKVQTNRCLVEKVYKQYRDPPLISPPLKHSKGAFNEGDKNDSLIIVTEN